MTDRIQISEGQHDTGATLDLAFRKGDGLLVVIATQNEYNLTREILESLIGPRYKLRAALRRYLHTVSDFNVVS